MGLTPMMRNTTEIYQAAVTSDELLVIMSFLSDFELITGCTGTYRCLKPLGHGAFGEVLLGQHTTTGQHVALKQLYLPEPGAPVPAAVAREVSALQQLQHRNIIKLMDVIVSGCCVYLCQELCCTDLASLVAAANHQLPAKLTCSILQQLLSALAACHACGIMHRDVKPSNILVTAAGTIRLADFGLAKSFLQPEPGSCRCTMSPQAGASSSCSCSQQHLVPTGWPPRSAAVHLVKELLHQQPEHQPSSVEYLHTGCQGTRWYRAPELLFGSRKYGPEVDMWAAGMVFAEVLGLTPFIPGVSDIDQLARMQHKLGSITPKQWPGVQELPDWQKISFAHSQGQPLNVLLPDAPADALDLLQLLIAYNPDSRVSAAAALQHRYFASISSCMS